MHFGLRIRKPRRERTMSGRSVFRGVMIVICTSFVVISSGCSAGRYAAMSGEDKETTTVEHTQTRRSRARIPRYEEREYTRIVSTQRTARPYRFEGSGSEPRNPCYPTAR